MSKCIYCKKPAGFFVKRHPECEKSNQDGLEYLGQYVQDYFLSEESNDSFLKNVKNITEKHFINNSQLLKCIIRKWGFSIKSNIYDEEISDSKIKKYFWFQEIFILKNQKNIESTFGKIKLEKGVGYNYYSSEVEYVGDEGEKIICKNYRGDLQQINPFLLKYYENIQRVSMGGLSELEEFKKDYFNKKLLEKFVGREEPENIKEAIEHYKTLLSIENNNSNNYATKGFIYYILKLEEKVGIKKLDENYIMKVKSGLGIQNDDLDKDSTWQNFVKLLVLKDIADEKLPSRVEVTNDIPFNLQKGEKIIWLTNLVELYEETISKSYEGGSVGMSFRVAPGTYLRASEYKGQPIETVNNKFITKGIIGYTQKHLYFFSFKKSFKIRYDKIVSLVPRSNGIIIMTEGVSKKPITFKNEDGVFIYNLITSLTRCEIELK